MDYLTKFITLFSHTIRILSCGFKYHKSSIIIAIKIRSLKNKNGANYKKLAPFGFLVTKASMFSNTFIDDLVRLSQIKQEFMSF